MNRNADLLFDCREIGSYLADCGKHATEPGNLSPWLQAFRDWNDLCADLGYIVAIAEVFAGYTARMAEREEDESAAYDDYLASLGSHIDGTEGEENE